MTKKMQQKVMAEQETEEQIGPIAREMLKAGVSKELTLGALSGAAQKFLEEFSAQRGVRPDQLELRAYFIAEKVIASSALSILSA